jgi:hypothetical protein
MVNLTAFDIFTHLWGDVDGKSAFQDIHGFTAQLGFPVTP